MRSPLAAVPMRLTAPSLLLPVLLLAPHALHASGASLDPPVGARYLRTLHLPVIGKQTLQLDILGATEARLLLAGALNLDEPVEYTVCQETGALDFRLTDNTHRILRRFRTSLRAAAFDPVEDEAFVTVAPPVVPAIKIKLNRVEADAEAPPGAMPGAPPGSRHVRPPPVVFASR